MFGLKKILSSLVPVPLSGKVNIFVDENGLLKSKDENGNIGTPGGGTVPLSNTCYVNTGLSVNDLTGKIFKSYSEALSWIIANGNPAADNLWQIILPAGNVGEINLAEFIFISGNNGTIIDNLISNIDYSSIVLGNNIVENVKILNLHIENSKGIFLRNSIIYSIDNTSGILLAINSFFFNTDFIDISARFYNSYFNNDCNFSNNPVCQFDHCSFNKSATFNNNPSGYFLSFCDCEYIIANNSCTIQISHSMVKDFTFDLDGINSLVIYSSNIHSISGSGSIFSQSTYFDNSMTPGLSNNVQNAIVDLYNLIIGS